VQEREFSVVDCVWWRNQYIVALVQRASPKARDDGAEGVRARGRGSAGGKAGGGDGSGGGDADDVESGTRFELRVYPSTHLDRRSMLCSVELPPGTVPRKLCLGSFVGSAAPTLPVSPDTLRPRASADEVRSRVTWVVVVADSTAAAELAAASSSAATLSPTSVTSPASVASDPASSPAHGTVASAAAGHAVASTDHTVLWRFGSKVTSVPELLVYQIKLSTKLSPRSERRRVGVGIGIGIGERLTSATAYMSPTSAQSFVSASVGGASIDEVPTSSVLVTTTLLLHRKIVLPTSAHAPVSCAVLPQLGSRLPVGESATTPVRHGSGTPLSPPCTLLVSPLATRMGATRAAAANGGGAAPSAPTAAAGAGVADADVGTTPRTAAATTPRSARFPPPPVHTSTPVGSQTPGDAFDADKYNSFLPRVLLLTRDANLVDIDTSTGVQSLIATGVRRFWCVRESVFGGSSGTLAVYLLRGQRVQVRRRRSCQPLRQRPPL
jgi:hypothetical protein